MATPARLACVKPAASVRSEPGSNSQVGLETSNRLITTFDEVPPFFAGRSRQAACDSHRGQRWCNLCKRVPPKSFVRPRNKKTEVFKYPRPRKDSAVHVSLSSSSLVKQPGTLRTLSPEGVPTLSIRRQITTDLDRLLIHSS